MKKRYGQHFLTDRNILRRIVQFAQATNTVVEIGPGAGALTRELAAVAERVIAIEIDRDLIAGLRANMPPNVEIVEGDALESPFPVSPFHLVGNLPYNVATPLIQRFLAHREQILDATVMIQKEVAERLIAEPRTKEYGPLSVLVQYYADVRYGFTIPPGAFKPPPKVDSALVRLTWKPGIPYFPEFTDFVHKAFASRRKTLANNLVRVLGLPRGEISEKLGPHAMARPEELTVAEFLYVYNQFK